MLKTGNPLVDKFFGIHLAITVLIFSTYCLWFRTPLIFDDYRYLLSSYSDGFSLSSIGEFVSRLPVFSVLLFCLLKLKFLTSTFYFFFILHFAFHSTSVFFISRYVYNLFTGKSIQDPVSHPYLFVALTCTFTFYPSFMELVLWPHAASYFWGGIFMIAGLYSRKWYIQLIAFAASFATYETYILPSFCLLLLKYFLEPTRLQGYRGLISCLKIPFISLSVFIVSRLLLANLLGSYHQEVSLDFKANCIRIIKYVIFIHNFDGATAKMYVYEPAFVFVSILILLFYKQYSLIRKLSLGLGLLLLSCLTDLFVSYPALRVLYGSFLFKVGLLSVTMLYISQLGLSCRYFVFVYLGVMVSLSSLNLFHYGIIRRHDHQVFADLKRRMMHLVESKQTSGTLIFASLDHDLDPKDWVIYPYNTQVPIDIYKYEEPSLAALNIDFDDKKDYTDNSVKFPILFTSNSFVYESSRKVVKDLQALSGELLSVNLNSAYNMGPYISLSPGTYRVEVSTLSRTTRPIPSDYKHIHAFADSGKTRIPLNAEPMALSGKFEVFAYQFTIPARGKHISFSLNQHAHIRSINYLKLDKLH